MMSSWQYYGWPVFVVLWAVVAAVGLVIAIRRRGRPAARWAVAAFTVMLVWAVYSLVTHVVWVLSMDEVGWAVVWYQRLSDLPVFHLIYAAGFALLVPAIFAGRKSVTSDDPDAD